ncbi:hypothetical protein JOD57_004170 [Geodermatophilus bullaregiensis]|uniref:hypothetical protein n=1 Tax=Geodermatophilus bullaregiensis TaxID=1564160 RepID=UPI00195A8670|nr:hypothetical protein [Geodermatophilus bullaregiensis]MBM7808333.1 hypothetical protein [Geodermatophilus bullaregiensis]
MTDDGLTEGDAVLAALLGVPVGALARALGAGWTEVPGPAHEQWFVSGEPAQVAVGWDGFGFTLARPEPRWDGVWPLVWEFAADRRFQAEEVLYEPEVLAEAAEEVARRRRRTFRWCPVCREVNAREHVHDSTGLCSRCAGHFLGIVH